MPHRRRRDSIDDSLSAASLGEGQSESYVPPRRSFTSRSPDGPEYHAQVDAYIEDQADTPSKSS